MTPAYRYKAALKRVVDGDTMELVVDLGFGVSATVMVRVKDLWAPERSTPEGQRVTAWLRDLLVGAALVIETHKSASGKDVQTFARYVAMVWVNGTPLQDLYLAAGFTPGGIGAQ